MSSGAALQSVQLLSTSSLTLRKRTVPVVPFAEAVPSAKYAIATGLYEVRFSGPYRKRTQSSSDATKLASVVRRYQPRPEVFSTPASMYW